MSHNEIEDIKNSLSYRLGFALTYPFRKVYDFVRPTKNTNIIRATDTSEQIRDSIDVSYVHKESVLIIRGWIFGPTELKSAVLINSTKSYCTPLSINIARHDVHAIFNHNNSQLSGYSLISHDAVSMHDELKLEFTFKDSSQIIKKIISDKPNTETLNAEEAYAVKQVNDTLNLRSNQEILKEIENWPTKPLISIVVPVYNVAPYYLDECIASVIRQQYDNWELCLSDDASTNKSTLACLRRWEARDKRIKVVYNKENANISAATNSAIAIATGEYITLLDNDDTLTRDAIYLVAQTINENPEVKLIYSDEDKLEMDGTYTGPYYKSDFNYDLLLTNNYICHLTTIKKSVGDSYGWFELGLEGSQDHDVILKAVEASKPSEIVHIPKVLYHWRKIPGSTASAYSTKSYARDAGKKALQNHLDRCKIEATVKSSTRGGFYDLLYKVDSPPSVSIIIPFRDQAQLLMNCMDSIIKHTAYPNYNIILVDNDSTESQTKEYLKRAAKLYKHVKIVKSPGVFNFSKINNQAVENSDSELVLLLNNDIEAVHNGWLLRLASHFQREDVGVVGARLLYPDYHIQHDGIVTGVEDVASHVWKNKVTNQVHHFCFGSTRNVSAVTGACLLTRRNIYNQLNGLDEDKFVVAFNDIDYCLKVRREGYNIIHDPTVHLIHHESKSRGYEDTPDKMKRFLGEIKSFKKRWKGTYEHDPYYNRNLSKNHSDYRIEIEI